MNWHRYAADGSEPLGLTGRSETGYVEEHSERGKRKSRKERAKGQNAKSKKQYFVNGKKQCVGDDGEGVAGQAANYIVVG